MLPLRTRVFKNFMQLFWPFELAHEWTPLHGGNPVSIIELFTCIGVCKHKESESVSVFTYTVQFVSVS